MPLGSVAVFQLTRILDPSVGESATAVMPENVGGEVSSVARAVDSVLVDSLPATSIALTKIS